MEGIRAAHDFRLGNWGSTDPWIIEYFSPKKRLSSSYVWTTQGISATYQRSGRTVQVLIYAGATSPAKVYDLAKVKVTVTYGVLR